MLSAFLAAGAIFSPLDRRARWVAAAIALMTFLLSSILDSRQNAEMARLKTWRSVIVARSQGVLVNALGSYAPQKFDIAYDVSSAEQCDLAQAIHKALTSAGWTHVAWDDGHTRPDWLITVGGCQSDMPRSGHTQAKDVEVRLSAASTEVKRQEVVQALIAAIERLGIGASAAGLDQISINKDAVHLWIGDRSFE